VLPPDKHEQFQIGPIKQNSKSIFSHINEDHQKNVNLPAKEDVEIATSRNNPIINKKSPWENPVRYNER
jgi:hypothetical protein